MQYIFYDSLINTSMRNFNIFFILFICFLLVQGERDPEELLEYLNKRLQERNNKKALSLWELITNFTDTNRKKHLQIAETASKEAKQDWYIVMNYDWKSIKNPEIYRQFYLFSRIDEQALPEEQYTEYERNLALMQEKFSEGTICDYHNQTNCNLSLDPDIINIFSNSRDSKELEYVWIEWRNKIGQNVRPYFSQHVALLNQAAKINDYKDATEMWLAEYDSVTGPSIRKEVERLWKEVKPLYLQLHAYIRFRLRQVYGDIVSASGPIPAHLLGNIWGQSWEGLFNLTLPYPKRRSIDFTYGLTKQGYTSDKIFKVAEEYFKSMELFPMPECFWENSLLEKPKNRSNLVCHPCAFTMHEGQDFRIKQCTRLDQQSFVNAHDMMAAIQYMIAYKDQPEIYQNAVNGAFSQGISGSLSLSVMTTKHLYSLKLSTNENPHPQDIVNDLFLNGLTVIAALPFAYLVDLWRWNVFSGKIQPENYNCAWWKLRFQYQGLEPPINRSEENFDPVAKYHIATNTAYIQYFLGIILQYQFQRKLCSIAKEYDDNDPLKSFTSCDLHGKPEAGIHLKQMMLHGKSKTWPEAMQILTGQRQIDSSALMDYFEPLMRWLTFENKKNHVHVGWGPPTKICKK